MTEIATLLARARQYLDSAALLTEAADYESSVSRSYYTMFYAAQAALLSKSLSLSFASDVPPQDPRFQQNTSLDAHPALLDNEG